MTTERISYLLEQLVSGVISETEREELDRCALDPGKRDLFTGVLQGMMETDQSGPAWKGERLDQLVENVLQADRIRRTARLVPLRRWIAAAAVLLVIATGYYWWSGYDRKAIVPAGAEYKSDVQPGGDKAVLTLANGQKILLDSAANGKLAEQGMVKVIKPASGQLLYEGADDKVSYNTLSTPRGGQYRLRLPDGTDVWLNAASSITYPTAFTGGERTVNITGEAYFEVAKDAARPFHVKVNTMEVEVLGTHFNINSYSDEGMIKTTLLEGSVRINKGTSADGSFQSVVLKPGQQAQAAAGLKVIDRADIEQAVAWKNGMFLFKDQDIESIMKQVSRWYDVEISYDKRPVKELFNGAVPRNVPVSKVFHLLGLTEQVHFKIDGKKVLVLP